MAHVTRDLPGQRQAVRIAVGHPVGGKFGGQIQVERAGFLAEAAQLDRTDPLVEELLSQILAQALADIGPVGGEIDRLLILRAVRGGLALAGRFGASSTPHRSCHALILPIRHCL
jgi:hypothetical protein